MQKLNLFKLATTVLLAVVGIANAAQGACPSDINPTSRMHGFGATTNTIEVSASSSCNWSATTTATWISILSGSGSGNGEVTYAIQGNPNPGSRTGIIRTGDEDFTIRQDGVTCTYTISPTFRDKCPNSTTGSVQVSTQSPCPWTVQNTNDWILITEGLSGTGSGRVFYTVLSNASPVARSGVVLIAGRQFTINQAGTVSIVCPADKTVACGTTWTFDQPTGGEVEIVSTVTNRMCGGTFTAVRTWRSTDICGNESQCSQSVAVVDLTPPTVVCPANKSANCGEAFGFDLPAGTDACDGAPVQITIVNTVTNVGPGQAVMATRTWRIEDGCGNAATCMQTVTFTNAQFVVICPPDRIVPCTAIWNFDMTTVIGGCAPAVVIVSTTTNALCPGSYTAVRTWQISDGIMTSNCVQTVQVVDQTPPVIVCPPDITVIFTNDAPHCPKTFTEFLIGGGQASDDCSSVTYRCVDAPIVGGLCGGVIERTHIALDQCGNSNTCIQRIIVLGTNTAVSVTVTNAAGETNPCGGTVIFCATTVGVPPVSIVWKLDNLAIPGETNECLTITNLNVADVGRYSIEVTGGCGMVTQTLSIPGCAVPAPVLGRVQFVPAGVHVAFKGAADRTYLVLCSPGLDKPWNVIGTATAGPDGNGEFIDPFGTNDTCRMYKLADTGGD